MAKIKQISIADAIYSLDPTAGYMYGAEGDLDSIVWDDDATPISTTDLQAEIDRLQTIENGKLYQSERKEDYPSIEDQLDMMYHDQVNGTTTWKDAIQAVKDAHPKPSE